MELRKRTAVLLAGIALTFFLLGCLQSTQYVCPDGRTVRTPSECQSSSQQSYPQGQAGSPTQSVPSPTVRVPVCGNGVPEEGETSSNCCLDAGCSTGEVCENNRCVVLSPALTTSFLQTSVPSVTILRSEPSVVLGTLTIQNSGNDEARDVAITFSSPENYFAQKTQTIPQIARGGSTDVSLVFNFNEEVLKITDKTDINAKVKIEFKNSANQQRMVDSDFKFGVYGRNSVAGESNYPNAYAAWISPHQKIVREFAAKSTSGLAGGIYVLDRHLAARWLFASMKAYGVAYVNDVPTVGDYVQLPMETLKTKNGDCEDLAILYSSLLESIGIKTAIILIPGHAFMGYFVGDERDTFVPVETTAANFDDALSYGLYEFNQHQAAGDMQITIPDDNRIQYSEVLFSDEPSIPMPDISKQVSNCQLSFSLSQFWEAKVDYTFVNNGNAPGAGCGYVATYDNNGALKDTRYACWIVQPSETKKVTLTPNIDLLSGMNCIAK